MSTFLVDHGDSPDPTLSVIEAAYFRVSAGMLFLARQDDTDVAAFSPGSWRSVHELTADHTAELSAVAS